MLQEPRWGAMGISFITGRTGLGGGWGTDGTRKLGGNGENEKMRE